MAPSAAHADLPRLGLGGWRLLRSDHTAACALPVADITAPDPDRTAGLVSEAHNHVLMQSPFNPGWNNVTAAACILPVAYITAGPPTLSNASSAVFAFNATQSAPELALNVDFIVLGAPRCLSLLLPAFVRIGAS